MAGDRINLQCDMWYRTSGATPDNSGTNVFASLLLQLASGVPGVSGGHLETGQTGSSGSFFGGPVTDFLNHQPAPAASKPQASVNWLLLDEQFGWQQDNGSGSEAVGDNEVYKHFVKSCSDAIEVQKSGYIYVYTSNQSNIDVYFDNLQVSMVHGPLLEETHYYPFGLTMQGISSKAAGKLNNKLKYNSKEEQRQEFSDGSGLEWLDYGARMYDNQIGRWMVPDPSAERMRRWSPYTFTYNNPISLVDLNGRWPKWIHHRIIREAFQGILPERQIKILLKASDKTDAPENQTRGNDMKHYMAQPKQSPEEAAADAEKFIDEQQEAYLNEPDEDKALDELGAGMHTLMDKTSPAHKGKKGPKVWAGNFGSKLVFAFYHFWAEANLYRISENRVQQAVIDIQNFYLESASKKKAIIIVGPIVHEPAPTPLPPVTPTPSQAPYTTSASPPPDIEKEKPHN